MGGVWERDYVACAHAGKVAPPIPASALVIRGFIMSWRTFKFFESEVIKDPDNTNAFNALLKRPVSSVSVQFSRYVSGCIISELRDHVLHVWQGTDGGRRYPTITHIQCVAVTELDCVLHVVGVAS